MPLGIYQGKLRDAVLRMKHPGEQFLAFQLGRLLGSRLRGRPEDLCPDRIVSVPMHWYRHFRRGINSALILAEGVAREIHIPLDERRLRCIRLTGKQSLLTAADRPANVRGAYQVTSPTAWQGSHVALVDDTMTTGATADEISRVLKRSGARQVTVLVVARAVAEWKNSVTRPVRPGRSG